MIHRYELDVVSDRMACVKIFGKPNIVYLGPIDRANEFKRKLEKSQSKCKFSFRHVKRTENKYAVVEFPKQGFRAGKDCVRYQGPFERALAIFHRFDQGILA